MIHVTLKIKNRTVRRNNE